jgi:hypothetical protein
MGLQRKKFSLRKKQKEAKREKLGPEKETPDTYNQKRKVQYKLMASSQELGTREFRDYLETRAFILRHSPTRESPDLPSENPTRTHYDLAKTLYGQLQGDFASDPSFFS